MQLNYANRHAGNERRDKSAMGSNDQRGGRCRARQGNGRLASEAVNAVALVANVAHSPTTLIVPIPTKIFTPDEWERLGTMRSNVLQLREGSRRGR